jgi:hypothetical protein
MAVVNVAVLIACHKDFDYVVKVCDFFNGIPGFTCFVHVDKKATLPAFEWPDYVHLISGDTAIDVVWGNFTQVQACFKLLSTASNYSFDYYWYMSGQDIPIKSKSVIYNFFASSSNVSYIDVEPSRFFRKRNLVYYPDFSLGYGFNKKIWRTFFYILSYIPFMKRTFHKKIFHGSQWFCLHSSLVSALLSSENLMIYQEFFKNSFCADESFFQTFVKNEFPDFPIKNNLTYMDWSLGLPHPRTLSISDIEEIKSSDKLVARKVDSAVDREIISYFLQSQRSL